MDAATAASMSDPELNPKFRRRWQENPCERALSLPPAPVSGDTVELTGRELLEQWRRERASRPSAAITSASTHVVPEGGA